MSREIKFRLWCTYHKSYEQDPVRLTLGGYILHHNKYGKEQICKPETHILMQYTGLKDKNGVEIYQEDWIKWDKMDDVMLVDFWYGKWVLVHPPTCRAEQEGECMHDNLYDFIPSEIEVIGNIYENPELLEN